MSQAIHVPGLSDEVLARLRERASQIGIDPASYVRHLIERDLAPPHSGLSFAEILDPVHEYARAHDFPESEIEQFLAKELNQARSERQKSK